MSKSVELIPLMAGKGDAKVARIKSWVGLMAAGEYAIYEGAIEIVTQMVNYNMKKKSNDDDLLDSCAYGPQVLLQYEGLLIASYQGSNFETPEPSYGTEIAGV